MICNVLDLSVKTKRLFRSNRDDRNCAGFSDACVMEPSTRTTAGVGEAPRHEIAEYGAGRLSAAYGDLATAWRVEIGRKPI